MDDKNIDKLLDRYFEGLTTLREEKQLREYFRREKIDPELVPYQDLFRHFDTSHRETLSDDFDRRLIQRISDMESTPSRRLWPVLARIAAAIVLAVGIWWFYPQPQPPQPQAGIDWSKYEPKSPEEAYRLTRMALTKMSGELHQGASTATQKMNKIQEATRFFHD